MVVYISYINFPFHLSLMPNLLASNSKYSLNSLTSVESIVTFFVFLKWVNLHSDVTGPMFYERSDIYALPLILNLHEMVSSDNSLDAFQLTP